jgi:hypothetical protein
MGRFEHLGRCAFGRLPRLHAHHIAASGDFLVGRAQHIHDHKGIYVAAS